MDFGTIATQLADFGKFATAFVDFLQGFAKMFATFGDWAADDNVTTGDGNVGVLEQTSSIFKGDGILTDPIPEPTE